MTPAEFPAKWGPGDSSVQLNEDIHFLDLCELLDVPKPGSVGLSGTNMCIEQRARLTGAVRGHLNAAYMVRLEWREPPDKRSLLRCLWR